MKHQETIELLKGLVATSNDGEYVFRSGAAHASSPELTMILICLADNCQQGARELQRCLVWLGGPVVADRSPSVLLRRAGLGIRRLLSGNDDLAVLKACQRAEQTAVLSYRQALEKSLPGPVQALLERHYRGVRLNCIRIRDLRVMHQAIGQTDYADAKNIVALRAARADDADPLHKRNRG